MSQGRRNKRAPRGGHSLVDPLEFTETPALPTRHNAYVRRPKLVSRLREARDYPLLLVTAPAGYAKTNVLAEWGE